MKPAYPVAAIALLLATLSSAHADEDPGMLPMTSCQESWLDWKQDPVKAEKFSRQFQSRFKRNEREASFSPIGESTLFGHRINRVYPQSVGMGLGYSVVVEASFDTARASFEKQTGKRFKQCEASEGMKSCELEIGPKKTMVIMEAGRGAHAQTLLGCYYYYQQ